MEINSKWMIGEKMMKQLHSVNNSNFSKLLTSDIFGKIWKVSINFNEPEQIGKCSFGSSLCRLPYGVSKIAAKHTILFKESNKTEIGECEYTVENNTDKFKNFCSSKEFFTYSRHTISINTIIIKLWNNENKIIYSYDPFQKIVKKWNQFIRCIEEEKDENIKTIKVKSMKLSSSYEWVIENKSIIYNILNCENGTKFQSSKFFVGGLEWKISICPNGDDQTTIGSFDIDLGLDTLPTIWKCIIIRFTLHSPQTDSKMTAIVSYHFSGQRWGWDSYSLTLAEIKALNPTKLIFNADIEIIRIITEKEKDMIFYQKSLKIDPKLQINEKWIIDQHLMNKIKNLKHFGKQFSSDIFGKIWVMRLCPHGFEDDNDGNCQMGLALCNLPYNICKISLQYTISLIEANKSKTNEFEYDIGNECNYQVLCNFEEFINFSAHTIVININ
eukprot:357213_1